MSYQYIDGMESISVSVYFCKITTGGLNRNMRTGYRANDAGELTICIKFLLECPLQSREILYTPCVIMLLYYILDE